MGTSFTTGQPRLRLLDGAGATIKTLWLPSPTKGQAILTWKEKAITQELVTGDERLRRLGFIPVLRLRWKVYDDRNQGRYVIGSADGQQADYATFLALLATTPGRLKVSPGPASGGFIALVTKWPTETPIAGSFASDVEVEFTGRDILSTPVLGTF